jgi:Protein of unknown function (DUF3489)
MTTTTMTNQEETDTTAAVAAQGADVASKKATAKKGTSQKKGAPKGKKAAKAAAAPKKEAKPSKKAVKATGKEAGAPRAESKGAKILEMIRRPQGATLAEIMKAAEWQAHSVRGFISTAGKKHGVKIESAKNEAGGRFYKIK